MDGLLIMLLDLPEYMSEHTTQLSVFVYNNDHTNERHVQKTSGRVNRKGSTLRKLTDVKMMSNSMSQ